jgi:hypothetical protein
VEDAPGPRSGPHRDDPRVYWFFAVAEPVPGAAGIVGRVLDDTHPRIRTRIDELVAAMTPAERFAAMASMTEFVIEQSKAAIAATMPGATPLEIDLRWSEIHYGRELTDRVRRWLSQRP